MKILSVILIFCSSKLCAFDATVIGLLSQHCNKNAFESYYENINFISQKLEYLDNNISIAKANFFLIIIDGKKLLETKIGAQAMMIANKISQEFRDVKFVILNPQEDKANSVFKLKLLYYADDFKFTIYDADIFIIRATKDIDSIFSRISEEYIY
jgi:hypothetical protein